MADPYFKEEKGRKGCWIIRYKRYLDAETFQWKDKRTKAKTKAEAVRLQKELEGEQERIRLGLQAAPVKVAGTLGDHLEWWIKHYLVGTPDGRNEGRIRKHLLGDNPIAKVPVSLAAAELKQLLKAKEKAGELKGSSLNHLRGYVHRAFEKAIEEKRLPGPNPIGAIDTFEVDNAPFDYLRFQEVAPVLEAIRANTRALFATAIFAGLRKGELFGLKKEDVFFDFMMIRVSRSHGVAKTKGGKRGVPGGRQRWVPIHPELLPYLRHAYDAAEGEYVFPSVGEDEDGEPTEKRRREDQKLAVMLRRAMGRAGITTGYKHVCRKFRGRDCKYSEERKTDVPRRRCPTCGHLLFARPLVQPITFHQLRHTCASLLLMSGADLHAVQRILGHSDFELTQKTYGHMSHEYLHAQMAKLSLKPTLFASPVLRGALGPAPVLTSETKKAPDFGSLS